MPAYGGWQAAAIPPQMTSKQEMDVLKGEADMLQTQLEEIRSRIEVLEKAEQQGKKK
jgi:prefoldin subunit 5